MLWPPVVMSQMVAVIGQGDAVALGGTRCLPPAASTADFTASGLAPVSMQNALKAANRGGSCTCASAPAARIATVAMSIGPSLRICPTLRFATSTLIRKEHRLCVRFGSALTKTTVFLPPERQGQCGAIVRLLPMCYSEL